MAHTPPAGYLASKEHKHLWFNDQFKVWNVKTGNPTVMHGKGVGQGKYSKAGKIVRFSAKQETQKLFPAVMTERDVEITRNLVLRAEVADRVKARKDTKDAREAAEHQYRADCNEYIQAGVANGTIKLMQLGRNYYLFNDGRVFITDTWDSADQEKTMQYSFVSPDYEHTDTHARNGKVRLRLKDGTAKRRAIARLVLSMFHRAVRGPERAWHLDGNQCNDCIDNLIWFNPHTDTVNTYADDGITLTGRVLKPGVMERELAEKYNK
ncbi:MAG: hypothetical protein HRU20_14620 [Pseudomonadales bacterium]|nr:hypothetical protein [Pseudomonadales bacterium]